MAYSESAVQPEVRIYITAIHSKRILHCSVYA